MTEHTADEIRQPSRLDIAAEAYVHDLAALVPTLGSDWGLGYDDQLQDFSPEFFDEVASRTRTMLQEIDYQEQLAADDDSIDFDATDKVTAAVMRDRLGLDLELHEAGEDLRDLNVIASPVQIIRDTLSLMPNDSERDKNTIASRLSKVDAALAGYRASLDKAAANGDVAARRQVLLVAAQCRDLAAQDSLLTTFDLGEQHDRAVGSAMEAFGRLADWLETTLAERAPADDAVGEERYRRFLRQFVGFDVDPDRAHEWGKEKLAEIIDQQTAIAEDLYGRGTTVWQAMDRLNREEKYLIHGTSALTEWMQETADRAIADLHGTHFDIPAPVQTIECLIDPAGTGGIFYTPPNDDFSRPGRMWWSVPAGEDTFHRWQELTTVYHEGVPGHHLQCGQAVCERDRLNLWRRLACWNSGHGEGWALYAEALMDELGYHDDPGTKMGLLDAQRLRAARVVLDTGVHLKKDTGDGGRWDADYAWSFLRDNVAMAEANLRFEFHRYLGWPGQAPSYALGQNLWQRMRARAEAKAMTTRAFHSTALAEGSIPMGILAQVVLGESLDAV
ncbi:DUF885 domain-containing protein [Corynebacterium mendelii]|uniref:DUF885 domain-containing protein n=1 Tax=Corynebacterium mendelii TaxID=2765362 RepID=A0A939E011_9CORY|nr:DUF885 domain-containing protein [Corynebacterium mendelii]MBN9644409.1 DUF885 domain-containing protein [Corynebacterium mendelii]